MHDQRDVNVRRTVKKVRLEPPTQDQSRDLSASKGLARPSTLGRTAKLILTSTVDGQLDGSTPAPSRPCSLGAHGADTTTATQSESSCHAAGSSTGSAITNLYGRSARDPIVIPKRHVQAPDKLRRIQILVYYE